MTELFGGDPDGWHLQTKVTYAYDESGYGGTGQSVAPTQHDSGYGTSFTYRGNQTSAKRWDVTDENNSTAAVVSSAAYNTAGSPVSQTDPRGRTK